MSTYTVTLTNGAKREMRDIRFIRVLDGWVIFEDALGLVALIAGRDVLAVTREV